MALFLPAASHYVYCMSPDYCVLFNFLNFTYEFSTTAGLTLLCLAVLQRLSRHPRLFGASLWPLTKNLGRVFKSRFKFKNVWFIYLFFHLLGRSEQLPKEASFSWDPGLKWHHVLYAPRQWYEIIIHAFISSHLDYCKPLHFGCSTVGLNCKCWHGCSCLALFHALLVFIGIIPKILFWCKMVSNGLASLYSEDKTITAQFSTPSHEQVILKCKTKTSLDWLKCSISCSKWFPRAC